MSGIVSLCFFMSNCFLFDYLFFIWLYFSLLFGPSVHCSMFHKVELKHGLLEASVGEWTAWWLKSLQWRHNEGHGISNHRYLVCLLPFVQAHIRENIIHLCNWPLSGESWIGDRWIPPPPPPPPPPPNKGPVTRKRFPFDDVIIVWFGGRWLVGCGWLIGLMQLGYDRYSFS